MKIPKGCVGDNGRIRVCHLEEASAATVRHVRAQYPTWMRIIRYKGKALAGMGAEEVIEAFGYLVGQFAK